MLDPLCAYLALIEKAAADPQTFGTAWNIGPASESERNVAALLDAFVATWGQGARWEVDPRPHPKEASTLRLDTTLARDVLGWSPLLDFDAMIEWTAAWYRAYAGGHNMQAVTGEQVDRFLGQRVRLTMPTFPVPAAGHDDVAMAV